MNREDLLKLAQEIWGRSDWNDAQAGRLERFAALVSAKEREECAKLAAWILKMNQNDISAAIRARGMK
jgi:hypothetical protein